MQTFKVTSRIPTTANKIYKLAPYTTRNMTTFFPRLPTHDFAPLFHLMSDLDFYPNSRVNGSSYRYFEPRFDVREQKDAYELQGELPGLKQSDVEIEFTDQRTLVIKGKTEREVKRNSTSKEPEIQSIEEPASPTPSYHKASVEDEGASTATEGEGAVTPASNITEGAEAIEKAKAEETKYKYWINERSVGEFQRKFTFPARVDQEAVKASLRDGILSVVVPKKAKEEAKKILIE